MEMGVRFGAYKSMEVMRKDAGTPSSFALAQPLSQPRRDPVWPSVC